MDLAELLKLAGAPESLSDDRLQEVLTELVGSAEPLSAAAQKSPSFSAARQLVDLAEGIRSVNDERRRRAAAPASEGLRRGSGVAASAAGGGGRAARMAQRHGRARPSPAARENSRATLRACGTHATAPGVAIESREQLAQVMAEALEDVAPSAYGAATAARRERKVATATWKDAYPEERRLGGTAVENSAKVAAICAPAAIAASGGVCLPINVDYSVPTWAGATRPLRDGLPPFEADRGGIRFVTPPDVGVVSLQSTPASGLGAATSVWTEATDSTPGLATKPVYVVQCGEEQTVYVNAIPTRLQFGNMYGRFAPEQLAANTDVALAAAAREAELELLTLMFNASKQVKSQAYLGATRDLLAAADAAASAYRYSHRIPQATTLRAVFPFWAKSVVRADLARELAHDNTGDRDVLGISDQQIEQWFACRGIDPIWCMDGLKAGTYGTGGSAIPNQFWPVATAGSTLQWPGQSSTAAFTLAWLLFAEGSFQFLDGGRLTLGVVRDSTLDATNDYETFIETFEGVAFRGLEVYQVQSTILPTGASAGTIAKATYHE